MDSKIGKLGIAGYLAPIILLLAFSKLASSFDTDEWRCNSGQWIAAEELCDGAYDCRDRSDERAAVCSKQTCASTSFTCAYGACVTGMSKCNGVRDCADNSDEDPVLCGKGSTTRSPKVGPVNNNCIPPAIRNSILSYEANRSHIIQPNEVIETGATIVYNCKRGFTLEGSSQNVCFNSKWIETSHPVCIKYCKPLKGVTYEATCKYGFRRVSCESQVKPNTRAVIRCRDKYRKKSLSMARSVLQCLEDGTWDNTPQSCEPVCGEIPVRSQTFVAFATSNASNVLEVPWHVGIYNNFSQSYKHSCGGSIINAKVVISAAHCFWDRANQKLYHNSHFAIVAGKYFADYYRHETPAQFRNISKIHVPDEFDGEVGQYKSDIAVLILDEFLRFNMFISPVCVQWAQDPLESMQSPVYGQVCGWGKTENGSYSEVLRTADLQTTNSADCRREAGSYSDAVHDDNFCVLNKHGTIVCQGDSGGGFAVRQREFGNKFYLWGVVSRAVPQDRVCTEVAFVLFVNIQYHRKIIRENEVVNRPDEPAPVDLDNDPRSASCTAPDIPNAILLYKEDSSRIISPGEGVLNGVSIQYTCEPNHVLEGVQFNLCDTYLWKNSVHPVCIQYCPPIQEVSVSANCELNGRPASCSTQIRPGTQATVSCQDMYRGTEPHQRSVLKCLDNGKWDKLPHKCEPTCGEIPTRTQPHLDASTNASAVPWHVMILLNSDIWRRDTCGGTIVSAKVIISAAQCFWNHMEKKFRDKSEYVIEAGKAIGINPKPASIAVQLRNISRIEIPDSFRETGSSILFFKSDIAVVVLDDFLKFNEFVLPACIDWKEGTAMWIHSGVQGLTAGWGTSEWWNERLRTSLLEAKSYAECKRKRIPYFLGHAGTFCTLSTSGMIPCNGDSGSGFAVKQRTGSRDAYSLWGVLSKTTTCSVYIKDSSNVYTNIQFYRNLVQGNVESSLPKQALAFEPQ